MVLRGSLFGLLGVALALSMWVATLEPQPVPRSSMGVFSEPIPPRLKDERYTIRGGDNIASILAALGFPVGAVLEQLRPLYDMDRIRTGRVIQFTRDRVLGHPVFFLYPIDEDQSVSARYDEESGSWAASLQQVEYETRVTGRTMAIESTLWEAAISQGLRPEDILRLAEIFQWDVDFNSELRQGAILTLVADGLYSEGSLAKLGVIHAARLVNDGKRFTTIRHLHADETTDYYGPDGMARRKPFLRSPMPFIRITSSFSAERLHPVLKIKRPHYGTDFAAPTGTPLRAVGDGTVVLAGWNGGHGKQVRIRHATGHVSGYSHLSKILVKKGQHVKQGDVIGKVGSTGLATGPHCHYELKYNGKYLDPMKADLPVAQPLPQEERVAFEAERDRWLPLLEQAAAGTPLDLTQPSSDELLLTQQSGDSADMSL